MEIATIDFDDKRFDQVVHNGLTEGGDVEVIVKDRATRDGCPGVAITFTVGLPDGSVARAQCVMTGRQMIAIGDAIRGRFAHLGLTP